MEEGSKSVAKDKHVGAQCCKHLHTVSMLCLDALGTPKDGRRRLPATRNTDPSLQPLPPGPIVLTHDLRKLFVINQASSPASGKIWTLDGRLR